MNDKLFINDIIVQNQSVRGIYYNTRFGEDLDFSRLSSLNISCSYEVFTHKDNGRDHLVVIDLSISDKENISSEKGQNHFSLVVEGHYILHENVVEELMEEAKHFGSLSILLSFLRIAVHNITSMTRPGTLQLPLIRIQELHTEFNKRNKKKTKKK